MKEISFKAKFQDGSFKEVKGKEYPIKELSDFTFCLHKDIYLASIWRISEIGSGLVFASSVRIKGIPQAIEERIKKFGIEKIIKTINDEQYRDVL